MTQPGPLGKCGGEKRTPPELPRLGCRVRVRVRVRVGVRVRVRVRVRIRVAWMVHFFIAEVLHGYLVCLLGLRVLG